MLFTQIGSIAGEKKTAINGRFLFAEHPFSSRTLGFLYCDTQINKTISGMGSNSNPYRFDIKRKKPWFIRLRSGYCVRIFDLWYVMVLADLGVLKRRCLSRPSGKRRGTVWVLFPETTVKLV